MFMSRRRLCPWCISFISLYSRAHHQITSIKSKLQIEIIPWLVNYKKQSILYAIKESVVVVIDSIKQVGSCLLVLFSPNPSRDPESEWRFYTAAKRTEKEISICPSSCALPKWARVFDWTHMPYITFAIWIVNLPSTPTHNKTTFTINMQCYAPGEQRYQSLHPSVKSNDRDDVCVWYVCTMHSNLARQAIRH